jgi:hypothetical protein
MVEKKSASSFFISKNIIFEEKEKSIKEFNKNTSKKSIFFSKDVVEFYYSITFISNI